MFSLLILVSLIGAVSNRILGGLYDNFNEPKFLTKIGGTGTCLILFFLVMLLAGAEQTGITSVGVPVYNLTASDAITALLATVGMWLGSTWGWGRYIGALGGWEKNKLEEFKPIDWLLEKFGLKPKSVRRGQYYAHKPMIKLRAWGFVGLTLRGMLWGGCLSLALWSVFPLIAGALMGVLYLFSIEVMRLIKNKPGEGWPLAEWIFGAFLWVSCVL